MTKYDARIKWIEKIIDEIKYRDDDPEFTMIGLEMVHQISILKEKDNND